MSLSWIWKKLRGEDEKGSSKGQQSVFHPAPVLHEQPPATLTAAGAAGTATGAAARGPSAPHVTSQPPSQRPSAPSAVTASREVRDARGREDSPSRSMLSGSPGCSSVTGLESGRMYIALFDYDARTDQDLSFRRHEHIEVLEMSSEDWWLAQSHVTGLQGYIPASYVANLKSIQAEPWYFGDIKRGEAERKLLSENNEHGAFLIRNSESRKNEFSLSVRCSASIMHYRIRPRDHGGFFIARRKPFGSLHALVEYYSTNAGGLATMLSAPCVAVDKPDTGGLSYNTRDAWEIPKEQIHLQKRLGSGQFGEVYEGLWNKTVKVAVKTLRPGKMSAEEFLAEAHVLKKMRHPKLLQLFAVCTMEEPYYIITELMRHGSLLDHLRGRGRGMVLEDKVYVGAQVASGMEYLENKNFIHRDLAARNVLVGDHNAVKVADFGLSRLVKEDEYEAHAGAKFPIKWTAPEALSFSRFTTKSDVWSFGVFLMEVVTSGATPYPSMTNADVVDALERGYRMPCPNHCPQLLYNIMQECWAKDPTNRPTFETLRWKLEDYFFLEETEYREAEVVM